MANGIMVKNMQGFYRTLAFGVIVLLYAAVVLVIQTYAVAIRLLPMKAKIPVVNGPLERQAIASPGARAGIANEHR